MYWLIPAASLIGPPSTVIVVGGPGSRPSEGLDASLGRGTGLSESCLLPGPGWGHAVAPCQDPPGPQCPPWRGAGPTVPPSTRVEDGGARQ